MYKLQTNSNNLHYIKLDFYLGYPVQKNPFKCFDADEISSTNGLTLARKTRSHHLNKAFNWGILYSKASTIVLFQLFLKV